MATMTVLMMLGLLWMGMYPQSFLDMSAPVLGNLLAVTDSAATISGVAGL